MSDGPHCRLCGDPLHLVAMADMDEYVWVDDHGDTTGIDRDLRVYGEGTGDAYTRIGRLFRTVREHQQSRKGTLTPAEYKRLMGEYIGLNVRLGNGTWHTHVATGTPVNTAPVPHHCERPMWHRPSGWHCRAGCGHVQHSGQ